MNLQPVKYINFILKQESRKNRFFIGLNSLRAQRAATAKYLSKFYVLN